MLSTVCHAKLLSLFVQASPQAAQGPGQDLALLIRRLAEVAPAYPLALAQRADHVQPSLIKSIGSLADRLIPSR